MPSITTQTIGPAAASVVAPNVQAISRGATNVTSQRQVQEASQIAADKTTISPRRRDKDRAPQSPKRTEASYAPQTLKAAPNPSPSEENKDGDDNHKAPKVDITA